MTFLEARRLHRALTAGPSMRGWEDLSSYGELALRHVEPGSPLEIKFTTHPVRAPGEIESADTLRQELLTLRFPVVLLSLVCIALVIKVGKVTVSLDELLRIIGEHPRSRAERSAQRKRIWGWLSILGRLSIHGCRPGRYADSRTKEEIDLSLAAPLLLITGTPDLSWCTRSVSKPPSRVTLAPGAWLERLRDQDQVLTFIGNMNAITSIPAGRPSGEMARRVGIALNQRWRESQRHAILVRVGEDGEETVKYQAFTRRALLDHTHYLPVVEAILNDTDPRRMKVCWKVAVALLKDVGVVGYYKEMGKPIVGRKGWQKEWLDQPLDIRPGQSTMKAIVALLRKTTGVKPNVVATTRLEARKSVGATENRAYMREHRS